MRWIWMLLLIPFASALFLVEASDTCNVLSPGETQIFTLSLKVDADGTYSVVLSSNGLYVYPKEMLLDLQANVTENRLIEVRAPGTVFDAYYTLTIDVYNTANNQLVDSRQYCFRVFSGYTTQPVSDVIFGQKGVSLTNDKVEVTLFVRNESSLVVYAELFSDYGNVQFRENPVTVGPYGEKEVVAEIPITPTLPEYIKFFAKIGNVEKNVVVKLPSIRKADITLEAPESLVVNNLVERLYVRVNNNSDFDVVVRFRADNLPKGTALLSDDVKVGGGESVQVPLLLRFDNLKRTGVFTPRVCVTDKYGSDLDCTYVIVEIPDRKVVKTEENVNPTAYTVTINIENGAKRQENVKVEVKAPKGWKYVAEPSLLDIAPYETVSVNVSFTPEANAEDGPAIVRLVAPDGTVIAQRTINLSKSALTGYVTASPAASNVVLLILAAIVILAIAYLIRKGKQAEEAAMEFEELTKKD